MAQPIETRPPAQDAREALHQRLLNAPMEHAEALLAACELLQGLHDRGVIDFLRGAVGSSDKVLEIAVGAANSPGSIRSIRNLLLLANTVGAIDPEILSGFTKAAPAALRTMVSEANPPGLWTLIKDFLWNQKFRHGLAAMHVLLETLGGSLSAPSDRRPQ